jgi:uncharacterized protein (DUF4415 family)
LKNNARPNRKLPRRQKPISLRIDADLLSYFQTLQPDYKRRINLVLRSYVQQKRKKRA